MLVQSIYRKHSSSDASFEIVDIVVGIDAAECQMRVRYSTCIFSNNEMMSFYLLESHRKSEEIFI